jgi:SAM-dependent methyltransferase
MTGMRSLHLRHDPKAFWVEYWKQCDVDPPQFIDLDIYPIFPTLKYLGKADRILECGFGGGRVIRHLLNNGYQDVVGIDFDKGAAFRLKAAQEANLQVGDVCALPYKDGAFDVSMAFGVLCGLEHGLRKGMLELIRVTRPGGIVIVSLMVDNCARRIQSLLNRVSGDARRWSLNFYAWMDSDEGWRDYLRSFSLTVLERAYMISRYNFYYWTPFLRRQATKLDPAIARVCDRAYALNFAGEIAFQMTKRFLPRHFSGAALYVCRTDAGNASN